VRKQLVVHIADVDVSIHANGRHDTAGSAGTVADSNARCL
jgi:hypothetical protein